MSDIEDKQTVITCIRRAINELRCALDGVTDEGLDFEELELRVGLARSYLQLADPIVKAAAAVINADDDEEPLPTPSDSAFHQHCVGVRCTRCGETVCEDDISLDWCETCWNVRLDAI